METEFKLQHLMMQHLKEKGMEGIENVILNDSLVEKGTNFSNVMFATVKFNNGSNDLHLFIKRCVKGTAQADVNKILHIFAKEVCFYENILPKLKAFERENSSLAICQNMFSTYYGTVNDGEDINLLLERFSSDYFVTEKNSIHSIEQIELTLKVLAGFHATAFSMEIKENFTFEKRFPLLKDLLFDPSTSYIMESYGTILINGNFKVLKVIVECLNEEHASLNHCHLSSNVNVAFINKLQSLTNMFSKFIHKIVSESERNLLCHGDFHMWNVAFSKMTKEVKFFDFQLVRYAPCLTDIQQYLYQVSSAKFRHKHLDDLMQIYANSFSKTCQSYNVESTSHYSKECLMQEYRKVLFYGFYFGFSYNFRRYVCDDFYDKLEKLESNEEIMELLVSSGSEKMWNTIQDYLDMLDELQVFDILKNLTIT